jgi:hypothetical protein
MGSEVSRTTDSHTRCVVAYNNIFVQSKRYFVVHSSHRDNASVERSIADILC